MMLDCFPIFRNQCFHFLALSCTLILMFDVISIVFSFGTYDGGFGRAIINHCE